MGDEQRIMGPVLVARADCSTGAYELFKMAKHFMTKAVVIKSALGRINKRK